MNIPHSSNIPDPLTRKTFTLSDYIEHLCTNPKIFTMNGTFEEACAWIQGFTFMLDHSSPNAWTEWIGFKKWVLGQLNYPENYSWCYVIRIVFPDDKQAFEQLKILYFEYLSQR